MANRTRAQLSVDSSTLFPNNTSQLISPQDLKDWITNGIDSFLTQKDASTMQNVIYEAKANTIVAGATTNLATASGNFVHVSGTTQITSFGSCSAGSRFVIVFDDAADILASANLIIPGVSSGNNKIAVPGDCCMILSETPGQWRIVGYFPAAGAGSGLVVDVTASEPLSSTGGTTPDISIPQADGSTDGYLSAADWNTFDGKGNGTVISVSGTGTVNGISLSGTVTGSGNITLGGALSGVDLTSQVTGTLPIANGGTGTTTPSLVAGTNVTISGSWPNQTINASGGGGGTPGGSDTQIQYNDGGTAFGGVSDLTWDDVNNVLTVNSPRIGQSVGNGHLHLHTINTSPPSGLTDYITVYADKSPKQIGARFETNAYTSALQFGATTDRTYTLPDASGNVVLDTAAQTLTNKTLDTPAITGVATFDNTTSAAEIRLKEPSGSGSNYVAIKSQAMLSNYNFILPSAAGTTGQALITDNSGNLSWSSSPGVLGTKYISTTAATVYPAATALGVFVSLLIPANTFASGDIFKIIHRGTKTGTGNSSIRWGFNTANNLTGINYITAAVNITGQPGTASRHISILTSGATTTTSFFNSGLGNYATNQSNDIIQNHVTSTSTAIDWTVDQYFILAASTVAGDAFTNVFLSISPS